MAGALAADLELTDPGVAGGEGAGGVGPGHGSLGIACGLFDDPLVAGQRGERHELGGPLTTGHLRMPARHVMRHIDDVVIFMRLM